MKKIAATHTKGFSVIELVLVIFVVGIIGGIGYYVSSRGQKTDTAKTNTSQQKIPADASEADLALQNIGLASLDSVDINTRAVTEHGGESLKGFYVFGDKLSGGRTNPNFEFASLKADTKVVAAIDGVVTFIREQSESKDQEVFLQPKEGSAWTIGYDHLINVKVKKGDAVKAGDVLGAPAPQNNGMLRFEIQINKDEDDTTIHHCPSTLLSSGVKDKILGELSAMQARWESATKRELYDVGAQNPIGCLKQTLTVSEAEGR